MEFLYFQNKTGEIFYILHQNRAKRQRYPITSFKWNCLNKNHLLLQMRFPNLCIAIFMRAK